MVSSAIEGRTAEDSAVVPCSDGEILSSDLTQSFSHGFLFRDFTKKSSKLDAITIKAAKGTTAKEMSS